MIFSFYFNYLIVFVKIIEWTVAEEAMVVAVLDVKCTGVKDQKYYHAHKKFDLLVVVLDGLHKVQWTKSVKGRCPKK